MRRHILKMVSKITHAEMRELCSTRAQSVLLSCDTEALKMFTWQTIKSELVTHTPVLLSLLQSTGASKQKRSNFDAVVSLCVSILARNRNPRMCLAAKVLSLILYVGHRSKDVC